MILNLTKTKTTRTAVTVSTSAFIPRETEFLPPANKMNSTTSDPPWTEVLNGTDYDNAPFLYSPTYVAIDLASYAVCFITNVFGNTLTLIAICKFPCLREKSYTTLITLAIADLLVAVKIAIVPVLYITDISVKYPKVWFTLIGIIMFLTFNAGSQLLLLATDRFIAIMWPFFYSSNVTIRKLWLASLTVSVMSFSLAVFYIVNVTISFSQPKLVLILDSSFYVTAAVMMIVLHDKITYVARKHVQRIATVEQQPEANSTTSPKSPVLDRPSKMMIAVVGVYLLLASPFLTAAFIFLTPLSIRYELFLLYLRQYGSTLMTFNSSVNFIIYAVLNKRFRYAYKLVLTCKGNESNMISFSEA